MFEVVKYATVEKVEILMLPDPALTSSTVAAIWNSAKLSSDHGKVYDRKQANDELWKDLQASIRNRF